MNTAADREALEAERDFLLRSIADLDAEEAAGDLDHADHDTLRDDYVARAAAVLRALEHPAFCGFPMTVMGNPQKAGGGGGGAALSRLRRRWRWRRPRGCC